AVFEDVGDRHAAGRNHHVERLTLDVLHDDEVQVALTPDVVDGDDVRVVQRGGGAGLEDEALSLLGRRVAWKNLDGDVPLQPRIVGQIDRAHAAFTDLADHDVVQQLVPRTALLRTGSQCSGALPISSSVKGAKKYHSTLRIGSACVRISALI